MAEGTATDQKTGGQTDEQRAAEEQAQQERAAQEQREREAAEQQQQKSSQRERGSKRPASTPGSHDATVAASANPSQKQVTQQGGQAVKAEGQRIREQARKDAEDRGNDRVSLSEALNATDPKLKYDDTGALVTEDGKKIALSADATDPDVGWTAQHARREDDPVQHPTPGTVPDQTFHPDELPDPLAAVRAGQLPQNTEVLNIDPDKFKGKKSLEA